jgi:hypothetical protein
MISEFLRLLDGSIDEMRKIMLIYATDPDNDFFIDTMTAIVFLELIRSQFMTHYTNKEHFPCPVNQRPC